jgi:hypothetical protein
MDYLFENLGENRVTQVVNTNAFEQTTDYNYSKTEHEFFEDLFRKRPKVSSGSLSSIPSCSNFENEFICHTNDTFMYLMCFIKTPAISLHTKDVIPRYLVDFRKEITEDEKSYNIKKLTKVNKVRLISLFSSSEPIYNVDNDVLLYFSHYLKVNVIVVVKTHLQKSILCNEDSFDSVIIIDKHGKGSYRMVLADGSHIMTWGKAKDYLFERQLFDQKFIEMLGVTDLRNIALKRGISIYKDENGKKVKLLKEELKQELLKKI